MFFETAPANLTSPILTSLSPAVRASVFDQDVQRCLVQLIGLNGFLTNPDLPGTEKLVICTVDEKWLSVRRVWVSAAELALASGEKLISPQSVFTVKGFNRSVCALLVLMATMEMPALMEAGGEGTSKGITEFCELWCGSIFTTCKRGHA